MSNKDLSEAIKNILEKELKSFSKLIPNDVLTNIGKNVSPQIENICLLYTSPSPRDPWKSRMPSSA